MTPLHWDGPTLPTPSRHSHAYREFARLLFARAEAFYARQSSRTVLVPLADRSLSMHLPADERGDGIDPAKAFLDRTSVPEAGDIAQFSLSVIDDRFGMELPQGAWPSTAHSPWGTIRSDESAPYRIAIDRHTQTVSAFHTGTGRAVIWMRDYSALPYWAAATPFRLVLSWMCDTFGAEFVHGAAVGDGRTAVLAVGPSGAGKTTSALLLIPHGFRVSADDYLILHDNVLHPVYRRAKMHDSSLALIRQLVQPVEPLNPTAPGQKRIVDLETLQDSSGLSPMTLKAIIRPVQADDAGAVPSSGGRLLAALAPYSISGLLGGNVLSLGRLAQACSRVAAFEWNVERVPRRDASTFQRIWESVHAS